MLRTARLRVPTVFSFHTLYGEFVKQYRGLKPLSSLLWWLTRDYHNRADLNLTVSERHAGRAGPSRLPPGRALAAGRGQRPVPSQAPVPPCAHGSRAAGRNGRCCLTVSRLAPEKNVGFLADVIRQVPEACLAVVGDGPERPALEARFAGTDTHFVGYLKGEELAAAYASADAFVYASETETMGNVVLEAMACGCPVVAPSAGGIPSLVAHGETGLLYTPRDLEEAVRHTALLGDDPGRRGWPGRRGTG